MIYYEINEYGKLVAKTGTPLKYTNPNYYLSDFSKYIFIEELKK